MVVRMTLTDRCGFYNKNFIAFSFLATRGHLAPGFLNAIMKIKITLIIPFLICIDLVQAQQVKTENVILITLDGMRWQEVFSGAEKRLITKKFVDDTLQLAKKFWNEDPEKRRELLMPFFWSTIKQQGQLYGNRNLGNKVNVSNNQWFSYPGYNEILTGAADDVHITSNDQVDNPNTNVLEFINKQKGFEGKVVAYTSWENFPWIINTSRNALLVNAGWMTNKEPGEKEKLLDEMSIQLPNITGGTRLDALTFHYAFEYAKKKKPRVLYISFDETDHFAHEGQYDRYLASAHYTDGFIQSLWSWLQSDPQYKGKTTLIITVDHGRGNKNIEDWRHHGKKMPECDQIWFAFLGPDTKGDGEMKSKEQLYQNQIARTLAKFLALDYINERKPGESISMAIK